MKVSIKVFGDVQEKAAGVKKTPVWEQHAEILGTDEMPGCPFVIGHFDKVRVMAPGLYTADFFPIPGAFGKLSCECRNYVPAVASASVPRKAA